MTSDGTARIPTTLAELAVPIDSLRPYEGNPRRGDVSTIRASLEAHGQYRPVVVRSSTREVLAGNHTLHAATELGWTELAATFVDVDDEQARRIVLVDNRSSDLGGYDDGALAALLADLDLDYAGTGWDDDSAARVLAAFAASQPGADRDTEPGPLPEEPTSRPGDLWQLGEHRLLCGDATDPADVARLLAGGTPKLLATDPPYGVELELEWRDQAGFNNDGRLRSSDPPAAGEPGSVAERQQRAHARKTGRIKNGAASSYMRTPGKRGPGHFNTSISGDSRADWSEAFELVPSLRVAYVWHADVHSPEVALGLQRIGFQLSQIIVWQKTRFALSRSHYHWQHELAWYARRPGSGRFLGKQDQSTVWEAASPKMIMAAQADGDGKEDHPTQKPLALYLRPIGNHLRPGETFYDPFCGSGTALIAGENVGRAGFAMELDPRYVDVTVDRWRRHTGLQPRLVEQEVLVGAM